MVNCQSVSTVVKILNTFSSGLFEEDVIASSANRCLEIHWYTKVFSLISWYSMCFDCRLKWAPFSIYFSFCKTCSLQRISKVLNEGFNLFHTISRVVSCPELGVKPQRRVKYIIPKWAKPVFVECDEDLNVSWFESQSGIEWLLIKGGIIKRINFDFDVLSVVWLSSVMISFGVIGYNSCQAALALYERLSLLNCMLCVLYIPVWSTCPHAKSMPTIHFYVLKT